jgi:hypothetical protein
VVDDSELLVVSRMIGGADEVKMDTGTSKVRSGWSGTSCSLAEGRLVMMRASMTSG